MVKWQSSVTPRFLTESDKGKDSQTTVIKSGKEKKKRDLDFRPEDTIIALVLSSFSLSLFNVSNAFLHREEEVRDLMRGCRLLELRVVSI